MVSSGKLRKIHLAGAEKAGKRSQGLGQAELKSWDCLLRALGSMGGGGSRGG